jgi:hypothetical protein
MAYIFRKPVSMCSPACDPCWYLYWRFECIGDTCRYLGHYDPREDQEVPQWLSEIRDLEFCYDDYGVNCAESLWTYCTDPGLTPRDNEEAEEAALWLSGSLVAPQDLYELLVHDLSLIRAEWGDSVPDVNTITYHPYLLSNDLCVSPTRAAYEQFLQGEYTDLDSLNGLFGATAVSPWLDHYLRITFDGRYSIWELAKIYESVPSVVSVEPGDAYIFICHPGTVLPLHME